ncbi:MAG TPA: prolipoprotein diacylglyceryl transferase family protein [Chloroflexota bacterium]|nr:prolipoprotein diacylglyceryl transferase family protein [Chloroflexota bacterium]
MFVVNLNPIIVQLGPVQISWTGFFISLGILVSVLLAEVRLRQSGFTPGLGLDLALAVLPTSFAGSRLFEVADHWAFYAVHPVEIFTSGGASLDGAMVAGLIASLIFLRHHRLSLGEPLDVVVLAVLVGLVLAVFGSFLAGDASGRAAAFGPSVSYPAASQAQNTQAGIYPVEVYEAALYLVAAVFIARVRPGMVRTGVIFGAFLLVVGLDLFGLGFLREQPVDLFGLGQAQIVGVVLAVGGTLVLANGRTVWNRAPQPSG